MIVEAEKILCVGNWESDVGYAWWLMDRLWEGIARKYPGRVTIAYRKLRSVPQRLIDTGAKFIEHDFGSADLVRQNAFKHIYLTDKPHVSRMYGALRAAGAKNIIVHSHTCDFPERISLLKRVRRHTMSRTRWAADAFIACSDTLLERFDKVCALPREKCHLARNGIDLDLQIHPTDIRAELGLPENAPVIVSTGRANKQKGISFIIQAASRSGGYFIHCGDGPYRGELEQQIAANGLAERFFMLGNRSDVAGILAGADIAVHASGSEGLSLAILEFMRAGLPIILPDIPTVTQTVRSGSSALTYPYGNPQQLATHIDTLIHSPTQRQTLGQAAKHAVKTYDVRHTVDAVLGVFDHLKI